MSIGLAELLLGAVVLMGIGLFFAARRERRQAAGQVREKPDRPAAVSDPLLRLSRATSVALALSALALTLSAFLVGLKLAEGHDPETADQAVASADPTVIVSGRGAAEVVYDTAAVVFGLEGAWPSLEAASRELDTAIEAAIAAGVLPADIRTIAYQVSPAQTAAAGTPVAAGEVQVNRRVAVTVRELDRLDSVLASIAGTGVRIFGVGVGMADPAPAYAAAQARALADARAKADAIAASQGMVVIHAEETIEFEPSSVALTPLAVALMEPAAGPPPASGQVEARVQVTFSLR